MKRLIDKHLLRWKDQKRRKPLLVRGPRQVGKTYSVRNFGRHFDSFIEVNFEMYPEVGKIFEPDLDPHRILRELALFFDVKITPGKTLLFFDEIQETPKALSSVRYFFEKCPDLHIIAAGSLLDFTINAIGLPVGRVTSIYLYPLSFQEYLWAANGSETSKHLEDHDLHSPLTEPLHNKLIRKVGEYLAIGGMPEVVDAWINQQDPILCSQIQSSLLDTYIQDFSKYAKNHQIKYVDTLFRQIPSQLSQVFKYSKVHGEYRKRELSPCLDLLETAGVIQKIYRAAGNGFPLGAEVSLDRFKILFLDIALAQVHMGLDLASWFLSPEQEFINKGAIVESFVGQELLAYADPFSKPRLYYWDRTSRGSQAEVDYLTQIENSILPIEVKSGKGSTLRSLQSFLETHPSTPKGIRISTHNFGVEDSLQSIPLYAIHCLVKKNP